VLVLIVEDDESSRVLAERIVSGMGHKAVVAGDGAEGLVQAREHHPDLVLLDIRMPGIDGLSVAKTLRQEPWAKRIPIVAVSAEMGALDRARAIAAGCDEFVSKPYTPDQLRAALARHGAR
jgi:CheY-like chemotaxis protein